MLGRERHRLAEAERVGFAAGRLRRRGPRFCWRSGRPACRICAPVAAKARSTGVGPARASIMKKIASACAMAVSVCARMRPVRLSGADSSRPAVSITVNSRSPSRASPSRRSRVTPGPVIDQRHAPSDQPVEQRRFADIGPADDGDGEMHDVMSSPDHPGNPIEPHETVSAVWPAPVKPARERALRTRR